MTGPGLDALRRQLEPLVRFSDASWEAARDRFAPRKFAAGETMIAAGDRVRELGFLLDGLARYYYVTAEGKEFNKSFGGPGHPISSVSALIGGGPSPFFIEALEPCVAMFVRYEALLELGEADRAWERLMRVLLERLAMKKERREADFLLLSAEQRYLAFLDEYEHFAGRIPNYHIASYLGITEVGLSRIRRRLGMINRG